MLFVSTLCGLRAAGTPDPEYNPSYQFDAASGVYPSLGLGSEGALKCFMMNQISIVIVTIYNAEGIISHRIPLYDFDPYTETIGDGMRRIANTELNRVLGETGWSPQQKFSIEFTLKSTKSGLFITELLSFKTQRAGSTYTVPENILSESKLVMQKFRGGTIGIPWPKIRAAAVTIFDCTGRLVYSGDSRNNKNNDPNLFVSEKFSLNIAPKFLTTNYIGIINVLAENVESEEVSGSYDPSNGQYPYNPTKPLVVFSFTNGLPMLKISGGLPFQQTYITSSTDLSASPCRTETSFDGVGSTTLITTLKDMEFFSVEYSPPSSVSKNPSMRKK